MSGTRLPSPPEPAIDRKAEALLIVAHGDCGGQGGNVLANELARRIRLTRRFNEVSVGYLKSEPSIEEATAHIESTRLTLFPLFMSDGYYVQEAIPARLGIHDGRDSLGHSVEMRQPLGLMPSLPGLLARSVADAARSAGVPPLDANLLLVGHGNRKSPEAGAAAFAIAKEITASQLLGGVSVAFLEQPPFLPDALRDLPRPLFVLGLFAGCGLHGQDDLSAAVAGLKDRRVFLVEQMGGYAGVIELIKESLVTPEEPSSVS